MAQVTAVAQAKGVYYAAVGTALPAPIGATMTWAADGWVEIPEITEDGVELGFIYTSIDKRPLATKRPTSQFFPDAGLETIKFASYRSDDQVMTLAFPDATHSGAVLTGGGTTAYVALAVHSDNWVWLAVKVSATGSVVLSHTQTDWVKPPFEFKCFENDTDPTGTPNWEAHPYP